MVKLSKINFKKEAISRVMNYENLKIKGNKL